MIKELAIKLKC